MSKPIPAESVETLRMIQEKTRKQLPVMIQRKFSKRPPFIPNYIWNQYLKSTKTVSNYANQLKSIETSLRNIMNKAEQKDGEYYLPPTLYQQYQDLQKQYRALYKQYKREYKVYEAVLKNINTRIRGWNIEQEEKREQYLRQQQLLQDLQSRGIISVQKKGDKVSISLTPEGLAKASSEDISRLRDLGITIPREYYVKFKVLQKLADQGLIKLSIKPKTNQLEAMLIRDPLSLTETDIKNLARAGFNEKEIRNIIEKYRKTGKVESKVVGGERTYVSLAVGIGGTTFFDDLIKKLAKNFGIPVGIANDVIKWVLGQKTSPEFGIKQAREPSPTMQDFFNKTAQEIIEWWSSLWTPPKKEEKWDIERFLREEKAARERARQVSRVLVLANPEVSVRLINKLPTSAASALTYNMLETVNIKELKGVLPMLKIDVLKETIPALSTKKLPRTLPMLKETQIKKVVPEISVNKLSKSLPFLTINQLQKISPALTQRQIQELAQKLNERTLTRLARGLNMKQLETLMLYLPLRMIPQIVPSLTPKQITHLTNRLQQPPKEEEKGEQRFPSRRKKKILESIQKIKGKKKEKPSVFKVVFRFTVGGETFKVRAKGFPEALRRAWRLKRSPFVPRRVTVKRET